MFLQGDADFG